MNDPLRPLMESAAKGDQRAFRDLTQALGQRMFALAYRLMSNNAAAAEDAVQDALIKLWVNAPNWRPSGTVAAYAMTIVHHCCMDLHRKNRPTSEVPETLADRAPRTDDRLIEDEQRNVLMNGINRLPDRQKTALLLSYFGEESNRKIGEMLNISEGAVESLLVRARKTLARDLPDAVRHVKTYATGGKEAE